MSDTRAPTIDITLLGDAQRDDVAAVGANTQGASAASRSPAGDSRTNIFDFDRAMLERFFEEDLGEKKFRAQQVMKWIHHRYATEFADMTDLGKALRAKLEERAVVRAPQMIFDKASEDGTHKWLLAWTRRTPSKPCSFPTRVVARCACRRRSAVR